jgi:hypothetical protein
MIVVARRKLDELSAHAVPALVNGIINSALPFLLITFAMLTLSAGFGAVINSSF